MLIATEGSIWCDLRDLFIQRQHVDRIRCYQSFLRRHTPFRKTRKVQSLKSFLLFLLLLLSFSPSPLRLLQPILFASSSPIFHFLNEPKRLDFLNY